MQQKAQNLDAIKDAITAKEYKPINNKHILKFFLSLVKDSYYNKYVLLCIILYTKPGNKDTTSGRNANNCVYQGRLIIL